jgi:uncharacterized protein YqhQ
MTAKPIAVGGQALIEGVMMKTAHWVGAAARTPAGAIARIRKRHVSLTERSWLFRLPLVRGVVSLGDMLVLGIRMLNWSANQQAEKKADRLGPWETGITLFVSLALAIVLFVLAPYWATRFFVAAQGTLFNLIDGLIRIIIFIGYVWLIGQFKDIRRMYQYHGAEHMTVHCHEAGKALQPRHVRRYSPVHPRCGTSLLMFVIIVSILVFSLVRDPRWYVNVPMRIVLIPVIAGASYELLKLSARWPNNLILNLLMKPGLWVQKITTRKPDKKQIEVAVAALKQVVT